MKNIIRRVSGPSAGTGAALVALSLILRQADIAVPNCIVAASCAAGAILLIFSLGRHLD